MAYKSPGDTSDVREEDPYLCAFDCFSQSLTSLPQLLFSLYQITLMP